jgi:hypothetical protein
MGNGPEFVSAALAECADECSAGVSKRARRVVSTRLINLYQTDEWLYTSGVGLGDSAKQSRVSTGNYIECGGVEARFYE